MVTSGFYDTRYYNADQFGDMFDGIIKEGVFQNVGNEFAVAATGAMSVSVDSGRAWINKRWLVNDAKIILPVDEAPYSGKKRIDAVVLESDNTNDEEFGKAGRITIVPGYPSNPPQRPDLKDGSDGVKQMALAYITINSGDTQVYASNIEIVTGFEYDWATPWVTTNLETANMSMLLTAWQQSFDESIAEFQTESEATFNSWLSNLRNQLDDNQAAHLQNEIDQIWLAFDNVGRAETMTF